MSTPNPIGHREPISVRSSDSPEVIEEVGYQPQLFAKDVEEKSEMILPLAVETFDCSKPKLPNPDLNKVDEASLRKAATFIQENPWLARSFLAVFYATMFDALTLQSKVRYDSAMMELDVRKNIFEMAKGNAELQRLITDNQAMEQFTQAVTSLVSATVSLYNAKQSVANYGQAQRTVQKRITDQQGAVNLAKGKDGILTADGNPLDLTKPESQATKTEIAKLEKMKANEQTDIQTELHHLDQISQQRGEAIKSAVQAASSTIQGIIKLDTGVKEELKGMIDASIQALNKLSETTSRSRDDAKASADRIIDFLQRIIESLYKTHSARGNA